MLASVHRLRIFPRRRADAVACAVRSHSSARSAATASHPLASTRLETFTDQAATTERRDRAKRHVCRRSSPNNVRARRNRRGGASPSGGLGEFPHVATRGARQVPLSPEKAGEGADLRHMSRTTTTARHHPHHYRPSRDFARRDSGCGLGRRRGAGGGVSPPAKNRPKNKRAADTARRETYCERVTCRR